MLKRCRAIGGNNSKSEQFTLNAQPVKQTLKLDLLTNKIYQKASLQVGR